MWYDRPGGALIVLGVRWRSTVTWELWGPPRTGGMQDSAKNGAGWRLVGRRRRYGRVDCRSATPSFLGHELSEGRSTSESCALSFWVDALAQWCEVHVRRFRDVLQG